MRFLRFHPYGVGLETNSTPNCYTPPVAGGSTCGGALSRTTSNPLAGVWEITVEARRTSDAAEAPFTLTASILGASVSPNPDVISSAQLNVGVNRTYSFTNLYGPFTGNAVGTNPGSAKLDRPTIANLAQQNFQVTVDDGSTSLTVRIGNPSDPAADLDLFVYKNGALVAQNADGDSEETVTIANPSGTYDVLIDGYSVPSGRTAYDYLDVFANTKYGTIVVTDPSALHDAGSTWTA
ncbi:MAG TPA: pre-peptidase C-terminal domain-containing protein, partial [Roseiflexaceae bacterium]|nr:pre-peptidase C-terminal domain-containing protein [Roseiflexaceae bacterium]